MFLLNGQSIPLDAPFEANGTWYPANWLRLTSAEEKAAIGITEVPDDVPEIFDERFYWGPNHPKDLDMLKKQWTNWVDETVWLMLQKTDYMDSRKANDPTYTPPAEWITWRNAIRADAKNAKANIAAAVDVPALQKAIAVVWTADPNSQVVQNQAISSQQISAL